MPAASVYTNVEYIGKWHLTFSVCFRCSGAWLSLCGLFVPSITGVGALADTFIRVTPWEFRESNDCHLTEKEPSSLRTDFKWYLRDLLSFLLNSEVIRHLRFKKSGPWWLE